MLGLLIAEISIKFRLATTNLERYSSMLTEDYITEVYCFIDDMMKECWKISGSVVPVRNYRMRK